MSLPFCPPPWVRRCPSRSCGNLPRFAERNSSLNFSEKLSARQGEPPARFEYPAQPVLKKVPPVRANPLTQFEYPGFPVQEKAAARQGRTRLRQFACPAQPMQKKGAAQNGRTA